MSKDLEDAYALKTPEDSVALYRDWAGTYDAGFAVAHRYVAPRELARIYRREGAPDPVLDIGAGTGLIGGELSDLTCDAIDISQEMLDVAEGKGLYRDRFRADLTAPLPLPDGGYRGLVSAGTFTHGHVGPVCLPELLRVAAPGALFVLSVNPAVFDVAGFGSAFAGLVGDGAITPVAFEWIRFYENADHDHADDRGLVAVFRKH